MQHAWQPVSAIQDMSVFLLLVAGGGLNPLSLHPLVDTVTDSTHVGCPGGDLFTHCNCSLQHVGDLDLDDRPGHFVQSYCDCEHTCQLPNTYLISLGVSTIRINFFNIGFFL